MGWRFSRSEGTRVSHLAFFKLSFGKASQCFFLYCAQMVSCERIIGRNSGIISPHNMKSKALVSMSRFRCQIIIVVMPESPTRQGELKNANLEVSCNASENGARVQDMFLAADGADSVFDALLVSGQRTGRKRDRSYHPYVQRFCFSISRRSSSLATTRMFTLRIAKITSNGNTNQQV